MLEDWTGMTLAEAENNLDKFDILIQTTPQGMKNSEYRLPIQLNN